jgi:DNA segregation ATPase FtsK/SpoIIIE-like protein
VVTMPLRFLKVLAGYVAPLIASPEGRFGIIAISAGISVTLFARELAIETFGWGLIPASLWLGVILVVGLSRPSLIQKFWQPAVATGLIAVAAIGVLGIPDGAEDSLLEDSTYAGLAGEAIVRLPAEWEVGEATFAQTAGAVARITVLVVLSLNVLWPGRSRIIYILLGRMMLLVSKLTGKWIRRAEMSLIALIKRKYEARKEAQAAAAEAAAEVIASAAVDTEAALQENPSYVVSHSEPEVTGMIAVDDDAEEADTPTGPTPSSIIPDSLPQPTRDELWTGAEASAVSALVDAARRASETLDEESDAPAEIEPEEEAVTTMPRFEWKLPDLKILAVGKSGGITKSEIQETSDLIMETLTDHGVDVSVDQVRTGPTVTMYGIAPGYNAGRATGPDQTRTTKRVRVDTILNREKDLALALASPSLRFEAPIPGASLVGIEVPNTSPTMVALRSVMETEAFIAFESSADLPVALGIGSGGDAIFTDLTKMPHTLVAGATGSGKSVCMNSIITGLLLFKTPAEVRLVLIDPKRVELTPYAGVPHLMIPPIVEADIAVNALKALVTEMMERFQLLEKAGAKNIATYNEKSEVKLPYIVVAVDELADLMLTSANEVERLLVRLAQLGRATGIHLVIATQRPSVDVVTGLIKANFPSRISFSLTSQIDSRTIIDSPGAEKLLGKGDMLFLPIDRAKPLRVQGAFLADKEIESVVTHWQKAGGPPLPQLIIPEEIGSSYEDGDRPSGGGDELFDRALELAHTQTKLSTSLLQRRLRIGYPRAARLMDELEDAGVVGPGEPGKPRVVIG